MRTSAFTSVILATTAVTAVRACTDTNFNLPAYFTEATMELVQTSAFYMDAAQITNENGTMETIYNAVPFNIKGTATILDRCNFSVDNLTTTSFPTNTHWNGNVYNQNFKCADGLVNKTSARYNLYNGCSFSSIIDTLTLYQKVPGSASIKLAYVRFPINNGNSETTPAPTPSIPTSAPTASSTVEVVTPVSYSTKDILVGLLPIMGVALFFLCMWYIAKRQEQKKIALNGQSEEKAFLVTKVEQTI